MSNVNHIERFANLLPPFDIDEAQTALTLCRLLAKAAPVSVTDLAESSGHPADLVETFLRTWPAVFRDKNGRVTGFQGLGLKPTRYRLRVNGNDVYPWCAWDTLFIPERLGAAADVTATSGIDKRPVRLRISGSSVQTPDEGLHVSFPGGLDDDWTSDVLATFCHHVFFLFDNEVERWVKTRPDTVLLSLEEAFEAGARMNRRRFGRTLDSTSAAIA